MAKKILNEREQMIEGLQKRVAFKRKNLDATIKFHRKVEAEAASKIRRDVIQLNALERSK